VTYLSGAFISESLWSRGGFEITGLVRGWYPLWNSGEGILNVCERAGLDEVEYSHFILLRDDYFRRAGLFLPVLKLNV
jgi:hypothetical protein